MCKTDVLKAFEALRHLPGSPGSGYKNLIKPPASRCIFAQMAGHLGDDVGVYFAGKGLRGAKDINHIL